MRAGLIVAMAIVLGGLMLFGIGGYDRRLSVADDGPVASRGNDARHRRDAPPVAVPQDGCPAPATVTAPAIPRLAVPVGRPERWVTSDDYPAAALRLNQGGSVRFVLDVAPDGRVAACRIERSSGHAVLDRQACALMKTRARFQPPRDAAGCPVAAEYRRSIRWQIPAG